MALETESGSEREHVLRAEAHYLHTALFGAAPPDGLVEAYVQAHRFYCMGDAVSTFVGVVVSRRLDAEALELVLRRRRPILTQKFRILLYLSEATPEGYRRLVNRDHRRVRAWLVLGASSFRTAFKYLKGLVLLRRFPLD